VGDHVEVGQKVGEIRDVFGNLVKEYVAEGTGIVLFCVISLAINPGDALLGIGC
jgi:hypothetical protein